MILEVSGKPIPNIAALRAVTREVTEGKTDPVPVTVGFDRKVEKLLTVVKVGKELSEEEPRMATKAWLPASTQVLTKDLAEALGLAGKKGVRVTLVHAGHSAEKAGMKVGDILLKLDEEEIAASQPEDHEVLASMIRQYKIGTETTFDGVRDGKPLKLTVKLEEPATPPSELKRYKDEDFEMTVRELAFADRVSQQLEEDTRGVLVERVEHAGWAALGHVALDDILISINGQPTPDVGTVERLLKKARDEKAKRVVFFVKRGIHTVYLEIEPSWKED